MNTAKNKTHYRMRLLTSLDQVGEKSWGELLDASHQGQACNPFLRYAYLHALHTSGAACPETGWHPHYLSLWDETECVAAMPLYRKDH